MSPSIRPNLRPSAIDMASEDIHIQVEMMTQMKEWCTSTYIISMSNKAIETGYNVYNGDGRQVAYVQLVLDLLSRGIDKVKGCHLARVKPTYIYTNISNNFYVDI